MTTAYLAAASAVSVLAPTGKGDPTWLDNPALTQKFVPAIFETLMMTGLSTLFAVIIGTLLGLLLVQTGKGGLTPNKGVYQALSFVVNIVRSLPFIIGIIMLIGLVAKNGILIVEFANQKQETGEDKMQAIKDAALQRLRPILMTSASTVLGLIPLAFATGEGCNQRIAMGTAVVGGMLVSTLLTMYIVPSIYSYVSTNRSKLKNE